MTTQISKRDLFDFFIRALLGLGFGFMGAVCLRAGAEALYKLDWATAQARDISHALSILSISFYTLAIAWLYVRRLRPVNKFAGAIPSLAAILGGFLMMGLLLLPPRDDLPAWTRILASLLIVTGNVFAFLIMTRLGRSFSILPEGRRLVMRGPYAVIRHPLYLAEAIATLGIVINFLSLWAVLLFAAQLSLQAMRMHYEEKVLSEIFPEYAAYARKTWRLMPGVY